MLVGLWEANVTITISGLGALSNKANTTVDFTVSDGLAGNTGDWLVLCYAADSPIANPKGVVYFDFSASVTYGLPWSVTVNNSGNVGMNIILFRLPVDVGSGDYVQVTA